MNEQIETMQAQIAQMAEQIGQLLMWQRARIQQQLTDPVDDISRRALRAVTDAGFGSSAVTRSQAISSTPTSITVPTNPVGTLLLDCGSGVFEVPHY